jgi:hypothetical protein
MMSGEFLFTRIGGQADGPSYLILEGTEVVPKKIDAPRLGRLIRVVEILSDLGLEAKSDAARFGPIIATLMGEVREQLRAMSG